MTTTLTNQPGAKPQGVFAIKLKATSKGWQIVKLISISRSAASRAQLEVAGGEAGAMQLHRLTVAHT
jgi:hypothetical protein